MGIGWLVLSVLFQEDLVWQHAQAGLLLGTAWFILLVFFVLITNWSTKQGFELLSQLFSSVGGLWLVLAPYVLGLCPCWEALTRDIALVTLSTLGASAEYVHSTYFRDSPRS